MRTPRDIADAMITGLSRHESVNGEEEIEEGFCLFKAGIPRLNIWHWLKEAFDQHYN